MIRQNRGCLAVLMLRSILHICIVQYPRSILLSVVNLVGRGARGRGHLPNGLPVLIRGHLPDSFTIRYPLKRYQKDADAASASFLAFQVNFRRASALGEVTLQKPPRGVYLPNLGSFVHRLRREMPASAARYSWPKRLNHARSEKGRFCTDCSGSAALPIGSTATSS